ncbi:MAG: MalY/PatB family protein [Candidatus Cryptobacteroides sp.]
MVKYDFDKLIDRHGTGALKTDALEARFGDAGLLPMWVADMDFETPPFILDALRRRLDHPILGYTIEPEDYWPSVQDWILSHHGWRTEREWLRYIPGVVKGIGMVVNAFLKQDEKVIIQPPVYHPFRLVPEGNRREVVLNPLIENPDGSYSMDFENLEAVCDGKCRLLILSNPHNPAGILWDAETLRRLASFCHSRGIIVISDEIHCDMALWGLKHIPFATVSDEAAEISITFAAPSKTFNIAGVVSSYSIVPNPALRETFYSYLKANEFDDAPIFAPIATIAAFREGEEWRRQMLSYVEGNIEELIAYCAEKIPAVKPLRPQASFLVWLDCRALGLSHRELVSLFVGKARLALNDGAMFGSCGSGFMRLNVGCPRSTLLEALDRLREAIG